MFSSTLLFNARHPTSLLPPTKEARRKRKKKKNFVSGPMPYCTPKELVNPPLDAPKIKGTVQPTNDAPPKLQYLPTLLSSPPLK